jgi:transposase
MEHASKRNGYTEAAVEVKGLPILRLRVAGIDLGSKSHWVCAPTPDGVSRELEEFGATTPELERMVRWLADRNVESVAMESTGVYWVPVQEILERHKLEVLIVNTHDLARVPGRKKTDRIDCQWIQRLHSCGLLRGSFRPVEQICMLRNLVRDKNTLVAQRGDCLRRMQKSLDQMNVRVHRAVADIQGATGMAIVRAIVNGERNPSHLAKLRDPGCRRSETEIAEQLAGHWREDHLFSLTRNLWLYDAMGQSIGEYDKEILRRLEEMERPESKNETAPKLTNAAKGRKIRREGEEPLRQAYFRMCGVDLTAIDAVAVGVAEAVLTEYGPDLSRFGTEKEFISHLGLAPKHHITGGKPIKGRKRRDMGTVRVRQALRSAVLSLRFSHTALGAYFRHLAQRLGNDVAGFATARKVATYIYRLLRWGQAYVDEGVAAAEQRYQAARLHRVKSSAAAMGYELTPLAANQ